MPKGNSISDCVLSSIGEYSWPAPLTLLRVNNQIVIILHFHSLFLISHGPTHLNPPNNSVEMHGTQKKARARNRMGAKTQPSGWLDLKLFYLLPESVVTIWGLHLSPPRPCNPGLWFLLTTNWKRPWCWEGLGAGGEGDDRGWDGWIASLTPWTWVWVDSGSWW